MIPRKGICLDFRNEAQMNWWNTVGRRLVRSEIVDSLTEVATGKRIGVMLDIHGLHRRKVIKKSESFIKNGSLVQFTVKK